MASSLVLKQFFTRSLVPFRLAVGTGVVSASRFLNSNGVHDYDRKVNSHRSNGRDLANHRGLTTTSFYEFNRVFRILDQTPSIPSFSSSIKTTDAGITIDIYCPEIEKMKETEEGLCVFKDIPEIKKENVKAFVEHNTLIIEGASHNHDFLTLIRLVENVFKTDDLKGEMKDGTLKIILPKVNKALKTNGHDLADSRDFITNLGEEEPLSLCRKMSKLIFLTPIETFSMYLEKTDESLRLNIKIPGHVKIMETDEEGLCGFLNMPGLMKENVKSWVEYNTLFIEGKTENEHYISGIKLPRNVEKNHDMKGELKDGIYKVIIPKVEKEKKTINRFEVKID